MNEVVASFDPTVSQTNKLVFGVLTLLILCAALQIQRQRRQTVVDASPMGQPSENEIELTTQLEELLALETTVHALLSSEHGRRIANSNSTVAEFTSIFGQVEQLGYRLREIAKQWPYDGFVGNTAVWTMRETRRQLDTVSSELSVLDTSARYLEPGQKTLKLVLSEESLTYGLATASQLSEQRSAALLSPDVSQSNLPNHGEEIARLNADAEGLNRQSKLLESQLTTFTEEAEAQRVAFKLQSEFEREFDNIKLYLGALMEPGFRQPVRHVTFDKHFEKLPMSLSRIDACGALEETPDGLRRLRNLVRSSENDRDSGAFPRVYSDQDTFHHEYLLRAQGYLNKFGTLLVERGLLSP